MQQFVMPRVALDDDEQMTLTSWLVEEGGDLVEGLPALEVETSKASMEVEASQGGVLALRLADEGALLSPGDILGLIAEPGEQYDLDALRRQQSAADAPDGNPGAARASVEPASVVPSSVAPTSVAPASVVPASVVPASVVPASVVPASVVPASVGAGSGELAARHIAPSPASRWVADQNPNVSNGFLITAAAPSPSALDARRAVQRPDRPSSTGVSTPLSRHRSAVSRLMTASALIPQFSVQRDVDAAAANELLARLRRLDITATLTDVFCKAAAIALGRHPELNGWLTDDTVYHPSEVAISLATDGPAGVVAPVIHDVERLDWSQLASQRKRIVDGARAGRLPADHLAGGTFSISNVGPLGGDVVVPLLTPPQVAILGLGRTRPGVDARPVLTSTLVADHRAVDGADAARFLASFAEILSDADRLLLAGAVGGGIE